MMMQPADFFSLDQCFLNYGLTSKHDQSRKGSSNPYLIKLAKKGHGTQTPGRQAMAYSKQARFTGTRPRFHPAS